MSPAPSRAEQIVEAAVPLAKDKLAPKSGAWIEGCELPDGVEPLEALRETPGVKPSPRTTPDPDKLAKFSLPSRKK